MPHLSGRKFVQRLGSVAIGRVAVLVARPRNGPWRLRPANGRPGSRWTQAATSWSRRGKEVAQLGHRVAAGVQVTPAAADTAPETHPKLGQPLLWVRRIGYAVLGLKLAAFAFWSALLYRHFALTPDFAQYQQAWYLIAHGNLNPYHTVGNFTFWQNHAEFIMWPLALLYWVFPHGVFLLWLHDTAVVGAEFVAFLWLCEIAQRYRPGRDARWLAGAGLILLAVNPWSWWAVSFDFHAECLAIRPAGVRLSGRPRVRRFPQPA